MLLRSSTLLHRLAREGLIRIVSLQAVPDIGQYTDALNIVFIKPAVEGTLGILKSALNFGKKVKRIIITSSCAAIIEDSRDPVQIWDESNWGDVWVEKTKAQGSDAPYMFKYRASKTLAERGKFWFFY